MAELKRPNILAEVLIGSLTAVAFEEMIRSLHESAKLHGLTLPSLGLALIFTLTAIRFLVGNLLHLVKERTGTTTRDTAEWFYDLMMIVLLAAVLAFLGGLCAEESAPLKFSFFDVLCVVYIIDAVWILSLWVGGRSVVPWEWFGLDIAMLLPTLGVYLFFGRATAYSNAGILFFVVANALAFGVDVFWLQNQKYKLFAFEES
jgi:hypothetical protein